MREDRFPKTLGVRSNCKPGTSCCAGHDVHATFVRAGVDGRTTASAKRRERSGAESEKSANQKAGGWQVRAVTNRTHLRRQPRENAAPVADFCSDPSEQKRLAVTEQLRISTDWDGPVEGHATGEGTQAHVVNKTTRARCGRSDSGVRDRSRRGDRRAGAGAVGRFV